MGGFGSGKTHLAAAIANHRAGLGDPPLFVMVPDLLDHLRATFSPGSSVAFDRRFDEIRTASLLVLDDLGTQSMTPWVREKLYQLFNYRYNAELPTVITTSDSLEEMDARIRSRLLDNRLCTRYGLDVPSYHARRFRAGFCCRSTRRCGTGTFCHGRVLCHHSGQFEQRYHSNSHWYNSGSGHRGLVELDSLCYSCPPGPAALFPGNGIITDPVCGRAGRA